MTVGERSEVRPISPVERRSRLVAAVVAAIGGLLAATAGLAPTGTPFVDPVLAFAGGAVVVAVGAWAPWWGVAVACGLGAVFSIDPLVALVGLVGFVGGLLAGVTWPDRIQVRAVVVALAVAVLARSDLEGFHGASAVVGVGVCILLVVVGFVRSPRGVRRFVGVVGAVGGLAMIVGVAGAAVAASGARHDMAAGVAEARAALDMLDDGDYLRAAEQFDGAADRFERVNDALSGTMAAPARLVPVVSQNVSAGSELVDVAADALRVAAEALRDVDGSDLGVTGGAIDLDEVRAVEEPLTHVQSSLDDVRSVAAEVRSPWLIGRLQAELDELDADLAKHSPQLANAIDAVRIAPDVLGATGVRRYLVLFTSPAEARGLGGFVGNYAEIEVDGGRLAVTDFARRSDLEDAVAASDVRCDACPDEFVELYGRYGFTSGREGEVEDRAWSNITMPVHFPLVAEAAAALYPQSGGRNIDGVIVMDPYVVQELMAFTGPIEVPELGVVVEPSNAAAFILLDQYRLVDDEASGEFDNAERVDALATLGTEAISRLLSGSLPEPADLARSFAPLVEERRLLVWTDDAAEQQVLDRLGLLGSIPPLPDAGGFSVAVTNSGGSKIDTFLDLQTSVVVEPRTGGDDRGSLLRATVTMRNDSPVSGLPYYVIGNFVVEGETVLPIGTSRTVVAFYGPPTLESITLNGDPIPVTSQREAGWGRFATTLILASGESAEYELVFTVDGEGDGEGVDDGVVVFDQPLADRE